MKILIAVTGAFHGRLRVRRASGQLDTEGLERVLSEPSVRAIGLAKQLDAELVGVHVDKGAGEDILREAMAHGLDQGILIEGAPSPSDAVTRAATIADVVAQHGPFDAIIGPARSEFAGFSGTLAAVAGKLDLPCVVGVRSIESEKDAFVIDYASIFGSYSLRIPKPCVMLASSEVPPSYPTAWGIHDAYKGRGILRVQADQYAIQKARTERRRIEPVRGEAQSVEEVDGATLLRRLRSKNLLPEEDVGEAAGGQLGGEA